MKTINERVALVRQWMQEQGIRAFVVPTTDPHNSEYVPAHWQCREWLTGFDGSAGTAVVTDGEARLWTDSRYWIQAAAQLEGTPFCLMREDVDAAPAEWLQSLGVEESEVRCYDPRQLPDPFDLWWEERPAFPLSQAWRIPDAEAGESAAHKIERLLAATTESEILVEELSEIGWLLNLRGDDIPYNPFLISFLLLRRNGHHTLYISREQIPSDIEVYLQSLGIGLAPYEEAPRLSSDTPISNWRAIKNEAEQRGFQHAHEQDGVALVRLMRWLSETDVSTLTECDVDERLTALRRESPDFLGLSFGTISAYGPHGAIVHYEPTPDTAAKLSPCGLLLLDCGAHYRYGTTDITRTIALGPLTEEERRVYTLVLKGHLQLQNMVFPLGTTGLQLDTAARMPLWREGYDYGHGTGHGVGHVLGVHEGPCQIRKNVRGCTLIPFRAGHVVSDEPGVYIEGRFGVRIENLLLTVPADEAVCKRMGGEYLTFRPLTLCPYDLRPVMWELLTPDELRWLQSYHKLVQERLLPLLSDPRDREWLMEQSHCNP